MPELPEVERAAEIARRAAVGKEIAGARALHPSQRRRLPDDVAATLVGDVVTAVRRRGKHQILDLESGRTLHVHFRMNGDWEVVRPGEGLPRYARVVFDFDDGSSLALDDSRALSTVSLHEAGVDPLPALGPEATSQEFSAVWLRGILAARRTPIKVALLDQRIVAGIGNIYAAEALWHARIDPRKAGKRLSAVQLAALVSGVRRTMAKALRRSARYYGAGESKSQSRTPRFNVYDREGEECRRCGSTIRRIAQGGRSTYWCAGCQR
ncbi:MAG: bifunctional DNA-formamidopyrimidine glycosylase/DNA-(apurinic or apyrimidinic site) lyase [Gemmatimonadaceae bacterium]